jgi:hypothetical protein
MSIEDATMARGIARILLSYQNLRPAVLASGGKLSRFHHPIKQFERHAVPRQNFRESFTTPG